MVGTTKEKESLQRYSNDILVVFTKEQSKYSPNRNKLVGYWIIYAGYLFNSVMVHDKITITTMPPMKQTTIFSSVKYSQVEYTKVFKKEVIYSALNEYFEVINNG